MIATWPAPLESGKTSEELLLSFDEGRDRRILILPALFDEANKLRRFTVQLMRKLDAAGVDCFLPDLPGCNESLVPLNRQTLETWRLAATTAADQFTANTVLTIRAGALVSPADRPTIQYAPQSGPKLLRGMIRAKIIAERENGRAITSDELLEDGRENGLILGGWSIGAPMVKAIESAELNANAATATIEQKQIGGGGLWLRAEPDEDDAQATALAALIADHGTAPS
ncbi:MAG: hypothetical protein ABJN35_03855 [Erythrobacter sp.]